MYKLLIFDWDGTLMDSEHKIVASAQAALADLSVAPLDPERIRNIIGLGLHEAVQDLFPDADAAFYARFIERYREHFLFQDTTPMPLFEGAAATLEALDADGYLLAVATGKGRRGLDRVLDETGLGGLFVATRCADETFSKPHPQMLEEIIDQIGVDRHEAVMVGDTEYDLKMARNAGVAAIAVAYGVHGCDRLLQFTPLACLEAIGDLPAWLAAHAGD